MNVKISSTNGVTTTVEFKADLLSFTNEELFALIEKRLGHTITEREIYGLHEDSTEYTEKYGDKADKELLRLIKTRLKKEEKDLIPTSHSWVV